MKYKVIYTRSDRSLVPCESEELGAFKFPEIRECGLTLEKVVSIISNPFVIKTEVEIDWHSG